MGKKNKNMNNPTKLNNQFQKKGEFMNRNKNTGQFAYQKKNKDVQGENENKLKSPELQSPVKEQRPVNDNTKASDPQSSSGSGNSKKAWNVRGKYWRH